MIDMPEGEALLALPHPWNTGTERPSPEAWVRVRYSTAHKVPVIWLRARRPPFPSLYHPLSAPKDPLLGPAPVSFARPASVASE